MSRESLHFWAALDDNRIGPLLRELADAIAETDDPATLSRLHRRLLGMANVINSHRQRVAAQQPGKAPRKPRAKKPAKSDLSFSAMLRAQL